MAKFNMFQGNLDDTRQEISNTNRNLKRLSDNALPRIQVIECLQLTRLKLVVVRYNKIQ